MFRSDSTHNSKKKEKKNYSEKNVDNLWENHKGFKKNKIKKNNKLILKSKQRFTSGMYNGYLLNKLTWTH